MKLPLKIVYDQFDSIMGAQGADGAWVHLPELVALANSHAAQPGPPREDGEFTIQYANGCDYLVARIDGDYHGSEGEVISLDDAKIWAHRKYTPVRLPNIKAEPLEVKHAQ